MSDHHSNSIVGSIVSSAVTAFVALIPDGTASYLAKLVSVLVLAMVAELGRRLVSFLWKGGSK